MAAPTRIARLVLWCAMSDAAYSEGFAAGKVGVGIRSNPYSPRDPAARREWLRGWFDGRLN
jgi:hypothetical protein